MTITVTEARARINLKTQSAFTSIPVLYENQDETSFSKKNQPYIKQSIIITESKQKELGNPYSKRTKGIVVFELYYRSGTGTSEDSIFSQILIDSFCSTHDGPIKFQSVAKRGDTTRQSWEVSAYQVPFYYE